jgi:A/G-specific adenine glycosylase
MNFLKALIQWYLQNKRDLPWRKYQSIPIWLSEIITNAVAQGMPYFFVFHNCIPLFFDLAEAMKNKC